MPPLAAYHAPDRLIAEQLRGAPLFASLPGDHHDCLALLREGAFFEVPAGVEIVSAGEAPALIVVLEGALRDEPRANAWPAGSHFGVAETLAGRPFAAAIRSSAPTLFYRLEAGLLKALFGRCPAIGRRLLENLADPDPSVTDPWRPPADAPGLYPA